LAHRARLRRELSDLPSTAEEWWADRELLSDPPVAADSLLGFWPLTEATGDTTPLPAHATWADHHPAGQRGMRFGKAGGLSVDFQSLRSEDPLTISFWARAPDQLLDTVFFEQMTFKATGEDGKTEQPLGWKLTGSTQGELIFQIHDGRGQNISCKLPGEEALTPRAWQHVCVRYSGARARTAVTILVNGENRRLRNSDHSTIDSVVLENAELTIGKNLPSGGISDVRIFKRWLTLEGVQVLADEFVLRNRLASQAGWTDLSSAEQRRVRRFHRIAVDPVYRSTAQELAATQLRRDFIHSRSTTTLVSEERRDRKPSAWVLQRGEYDQRLEEVSPDVPAVLMPLPAEASRDRLGFARWLVDPRHPLTARVAVNRLWQSVFGVGLVKTAEDFGAMGDPPSHPALLDWLAVEFVESGWDVKHLLRLMVTSATYRQSARGTPAQHTQDPDNRHLGRGARLRLDAEVLRDQALAVSGLLVPVVGGPSVRPYQPPGLWKVVAIEGSNTRQFEQDQGAALYRRSLYTFWKRTAPPPAMAAFDAPTREQCLVRRERTNTPLQALVLLNDPQYVEAARHLAQLTVQVAIDDRARAAWMLEQVMAKPAHRDDLNDVLQTVVEFTNLFKGNPESATILIQSGDSEADPTLSPVELAAWTMAANALMNRDDFINKN